MTEMNNVVSPASARVLIVDDEETQRNGLASMVTSWGFAAETACDGQDALDKLNNGSVQVLVTDLMMPRMDGFELLKRLGTPGNMPPAIVLTAFGNIETAIATIHDLGRVLVSGKADSAGGACAFCWSARLRRAGLAEETERLQRELQYKGVLVDLVGASAAMQQVFSLVRQVAPSKAAVLITGESGTGKELVARAIHHLSPAAGGSVCRGQLRGDAGNADGKRAVRPREGRVHRRNRAARRMLRTGAARNAAAGRTGRNAGGHAGEAAARAGRFARAAAGRQERDRRRRASHRGHEQEPRRGAPQGRAARGSCTTG